jgi:hypothetical protein
MILVLPLNKRICLNEKIKLLCILSEIKRDKKFSNKYINWKVKCNGK